jgi:hypothetical protein
VPNDISAPTLTLIQASHPPTRPYTDTVQITCAATLCDITALRRGGSAEVRVGALPVKMPLYTGM